MKQLFLIAFMFTSIQISSSLAIDYPGDMDTVRIFQYYTFVQKYSKGNIRFKIGEIWHMNPSMIRELMLLEHNPADHYPLPSPASSEELSMISRTDNFHAHNGDSIALWYDLSIYCAQDTATKWVEIPDTVAFYIDVVNSASNVVLQTLDTVGYTPIDDLETILSSSIGILDTTWITNPNDTAIIKWYKITNLPSSMGSGDSVHLRIRVHLGTIDGVDRFNTDRYDEMLTYKYSSLYADWFYAEKAKYTYLFGKLADSLAVLENMKLAPRNYSMPKTQVPGYCNIAIQPNPAISAANINIYTNISKQLNLFVVNSTGQIVSKKTAFVHDGSGVYGLSLDISKLSPGVYHVYVCDDFGRVATSQQLSIVR